MSLSDYNAEQSAKKLDLLLKQQERISALEAELAEAKKVSSERYDVINKQAVTILSMRNCGNCADANDGECRHFYNFDCQQGDSAKKTYLVKWEMKKHDI